MYFYNCSFGVSIQIILYITFVCYVFFITSPPFPFYDFWGTWSLVLWSFTYSGLVDVIEIISLSPTIFYQMVTGSTGLIRFMLHL
jgi:hypothetical protein